MSAAILSAATAMAPSAVITALTAFGVRRVLVTGYFGARLLLRLSMFFLRRLACAYLYVFLTIRNGLVLAVAASASAAMTATAVSAARGLILFLLNVLFFHGFIVSFRWISVQ
jgi:hypothetical protein